MTMKTQEEIEAQIALNTIRLLLESNRVLSQFGILTSDETVVELSARCDAQAHELWVGLGKVDCSSFQMEMRVKGK